MLHIFLVILKVIGFLLLGLLGLLLLLLLCVLFWPVKYRVKGSYRDAWKIKGTVTFLGIFFRLGISYTDRLHWKLRIFGIPILWDEKRRKRKKSNKKAENKQKGSPEAENNVLMEMDSEQTSSPDKKMDSEQTDSSDKQMGAKEERIAGIEEQRSGEQKELDKSEEEDRIAAFFDKVKRAIQAFLEGIKKTGRLVKQAVETIKKLPGQLENILQKWSAFRDILDDEQARLGMTKGKQEIFLLLKRTKPEKIEGYVIFGFDDPATTGQVLGAAAVVRSIWNCGIRLEPDFEKKVFETEFQIRGRLRGSWLLRLGWKVLYDREIKYLTGQFKTLK